MKDRRHTPDVAAIISLPPELVKCSCERSLVNTTSRFLQRKAWREASEEDRILCRSLGRFSPKLNRTLTAP